MEKDGSAFLDRNRESCFFIDESQASSFVAGGSAFVTDMAKASAAGVSVSSILKKIREYHSDAFALNDDRSNISFILYSERILADQGAMGKVSSAVWLDGRSERKVLLKRLFKPVNNPNMERLFGNEAGMACDYGGDFVIKGFAKGENEDFYWIIMEFYEGETLEKKIAENSYKDNVAEAKKIIQGILKGLVKLHDSEIVHRDLKPANIMVRLNGVPVILDLGLACKRNIEDIRGLKKIGTATYAAPEQMQGKFVFASDIYSLGLIFIEMLTGSPKVENLGSVPEELRPFIEKCICENSEGRYVNAGEALDDLRALGSASRTSNDNIRKLESQIAEYYGNDGVIDEKEKEKLRDLATFVGIGNRQLDLLIDRYVKKVNDFRAKYVIGFLTDPSMYPKELVFEKSKELKINNAVVKRWINDSKKEARKILKRNRPKKEAAGDKGKKNGSRNRILVIVCSIVVLLNGLISVFGIITSEKEPERNLDIGYLFRKYLSDSAGENVGSDNEQSKENVGSVNNRMKSGQVKDIRDGKVYPWVRIGSQDWMSANMGYLREAGTAWVCSATNFYLYGWGEAKRACPSGWRLPTKQDFEILDAFVTANTNSLVDFHSGAINVIEDGICYEEGSSAYYWADEEFDDGNALAFLIENDKSSFVKRPKDNGMAVRCIRDE